MYWGRAEEPFQFYVKKLKISLINDLRKRVVFLRLSFDLYGLNTLLPRQTLSLLFFGLSFVFYSHFHSKSDQIHDIKCLKKSELGSCVTGELRILVSFPVDGSHHESRGCSACRQKRSSKKIFRFLFRQITETLPERKTEFLSRLAHARGHFRVSRVSLDGLRKKRDCS